MSEEANTRSAEEKESRESGLLLSVESMQGGGAERLSAQDADKTDSDTDTLDTPDILTDVDGTDESDADGTDAGGDGDGTDKPGDTDSTDASGDSDGNDS